MVTLKAYDLSSWILTECNLSWKIVKYCILSWFSPFSERFFSGYSGFPLSSKPTLLNSNSIWNARTRFNEFSRTPKCVVGKQTTNYELQMVMAVIVMLVAIVVPGGSCLWWWWLPWIWWRGWWRSARVAVVKSFTVMVVVVLEMLHHIYYSSISFTVISSIVRKIHLSKP